eukprot:1623791-Pyramimonas_sp.AAC.1
MFHDLRLFFPFFHRPSWASILDGLVGMREASTICNILQLRCQEQIVRADVQSTRKKSEQDCRFLRLRGGVQEPLH